MCHGDACARLETLLTTTNATIADHHRMHYRRLLVAILLSFAARDALAQTYTAASDLLFYGDNTEFANQFRSGETTLGALGSVCLEVAFNDRVTVRGGLFGSGRFGSHEFLEQAEPVLALEIANRSQRFIFGSLDTIQTHHDVPGPDRETLHGLLPPLQRETLTFSRGQEMGLQWLVSAPRLTHDAWINWQRLNTAEHRERFDAGYRASVGLVDGLHLNGQWHVVHEGGQQFDSGPVSDSHAFALGPEWIHRAGRTDVVLDSVRRRDATRPRSRAAGADRSRPRRLRTRRRQPRKVARARDCLAESRHAEGGRRSELSRLAHGLAAVPQGPRLRRSGPRPPILTRAGRRPVRRRSRPPDRVALRILVPDRGAGSGCATSSDAQKTQSAEDTETQRTEKTGSAPAATPSRKTGERAKLQQELTWGQAAPTAPDGSSGAQSCPLVRIGPTRVNEIQAGLRG